MNMNYKLEGALKKGKTTIIVAVVLWLLLAIVFIMPLTCGIYQMELLGRFDGNAYLSVFGKAATNPALGFGSILERHLVGNYIKNLFGFIFVFFVNRSRNRF